MLVEIQTKSRHLPWAKKDQNVKEIGLEKLFNEYYTSKVHDFTVLGWSYSSTSLLISDRETKRSSSLESIVARLNYISLRALPFVSLQSSIASS